MRPSQQSLFHPPCLFDGIWEKWAQPLPHVWSRHMEEKKKALEQATAGTGMEDSRTSDNQLKLKVPADVSFDVGRGSREPIATNDTAEGRARNRRVEIFLSEAAAS